MKKLAAKPFRSHFSGEHISLVVDYSEDCPQRPETGRREILIYTKTDRVHLVSTNLEKPVGHKVSFLLHSLMSQAGNEASVFPTWAKGCGFTDQEFVDFITKHQP